MSALVTALAPSDPDIRQRRASDPAVSAWVAASAGTGKTKVLSERVLRLMLDGTPPERILCLTFTRAAAAEMANRIARRLGEWATADDASLGEELTRLTGAAPEPEHMNLARRLLARVLDAPGGMRIQTIHAFCESLLGRFPIEAGVAPHFAVLDERSAAELMMDAQDHVLASARGGDGTLAAALAEVTRHVHQSDFADLIGRLAAERGRLKHLIEEAGGLDGYTTRLRAHLEIEPGETEADIIEAACDNGAFDGDGLRHAAAALTEGSNAEQEKGQTIACWLGDAETRVAAFDYYTRVFLTAEKEPRKKIANKATLNRAPDVEPILRDETERLIAVHDRCKKVALAKATEALLVLGVVLVETYGRLKAARGRLDYDDLIYRARDLLLRPGVAPWVLYKLDGGIDHILIDEAQDTNPDQWRVVEALAEEFFAGEGARETARTVFAVGDAKQSIYSFQRADPKVFAKMRSHFSGQVGAARARWESVDLDTSFRSTPAVLEAVDAVFAHPPASDGLVEDGRPVRHLSERQRMAGLVEIWPPTEPLQSDPPPPWKPPIERGTDASARLRLANLVANKIDALCSGHEMLEARGRPARAGDIMVLVRRRNEFVEELVRALKGLGVPVAGIDRLVLTDHIAVMDMIALGRFLLMPDDDLTLAVVLKSPFFGLDDDDLFDLAHGRKGTLWRALRERAKDHPRWRAAVEKLAGLLGRADQVGPYELYAEILGKGRGRHALLARLGPEARDPIDEFLAQALAFQRAQAPSLEGFLHWLEAGRAEIKRDLEPGGEAVRVMTVHGAKGLEAPIVFLPDTMQTPPGPASPLWSEDGDIFLWPPRAAARDSAANMMHDEAKARLESEHHRLLYVAMTRAEDRLYVCGWRTKRDAPEDCWYNLIHNALEDRAETVEDAFLASRPEAPGGTVLRLSNEQSGLPGSDEKRAPTISAAALPDWVEKPAPPEPEPTLPLTPSALSDDEPAARARLGADAVAAQRGRLIHRLLQTMPDLAPERREAACRRFLARPALALDTAARDDIAGACLAVLEAPEFAPVFGPGSRAEVSLAGRVGNVVLSGQVDRLAVTAEAVLVVDYKTGRNPPDSPAATPVAYLRQMAAYRVALAEIYPDRPVRCALLWTDGPRLMALDPALLDEYAPA
jgi:ATP-dependent helicase/nuclease subunit A